MSAQGGSASGGKKIFLGTLVLVFALTLSACGKKASESQGTGNKTGVIEGTGSGVINSVREAMGLGKKMECVYTTKIGDQEIKATTQVDGKNFKSTSEVNGKKTYSLMKDDVMYSWGEGVPVATKLALSCIQEIEKNMPKVEGGAPKPTDITTPEKSFEDATNVSCNPSASVDLSVPSDIQFQDTCETMKGISEKIKNIKIPSGANIPANIPNVPGQ